MSKKQRKKKSILDGEISIDQLLEHIDFADEEVEHAARSLPNLFKAIAKYRVRVLRRRQAAEQKRDIAKVDAAIECRRLAQEKGHKVTEAGIKELVESTSSVREAGAEVAQLQALEEFAKLLLEAYRYKNRSIQVVASLTGAERAMERYFDQVQSKEGLDAMRQRVNKKYAQVDDG